MYSIYCFGDSITKGEYDNLSGGWASRLAIHFINEVVLHEGRKEVTVYPLGISGENSDEGLLRIENEFMSREDQKTIPIFVFAYGANDSAFFPAESMFAISKEEFKKNLLALASFAKKQKGKVMFLNITPVIEEKNATPNHRGKTRKNEYIKGYNEAIKTVAEEESALLVDVYKLFEGRFEELFCFDGLHPNEKGHEVMSREVLKVLLKVLS